MTGKESQPPPAADEAPEWDLCLSITDETPRSVKAMASLRAICDEHLAGQHRIEVVDLMKQPERAFNDQVFAIPTVVRRRPTPIRTTIGDLNDTRRVLAALGVT